jgi:threonine dehydrogenase-like Zn-dependent dehydrogenase
VRAVTWNGKHDVRVTDVPGPRIENPRDAIVKVSSTAICGSDLHLYNGAIPTMKRGDVLGHEFMGEVVEVGDAVSNLQEGDRVIVPFTIACGRCFHCKRGETSLCDNSNPKPEIAETIYGASGSGLFGYTHMLGGYPGGQAQYVRVPFADVGPVRIPHEDEPEGLPDQSLLFLTDILPTGWQAALNCDIQEGDVVAVWGAGPVGQFAIRCALLQGASQVIAIDHSPRRLELAEEAGAVIGLHFERTQVFNALRDMTGGHGPDACIDAVGLEAHGQALDAVYDRVKTGLRLATDRGHALRQAIHACRKGGRVSVPGVYGGFMDKFPIGAIFAKGLTMRAGQTHVHAHVPALLQLIRERELEPAEIISHEMSLEEAPRAYQLFHDEPDLCTKVVLHPS